jgi:hypothetical protein
MIHEENWKVGTYPSTVVSDTDVKLTNFPSMTNTGHSDVEYYGGHLIAESIADKEAAEAIAKVPDMIRLIKRLLEHASLIINDNHPDYKEANQIINL